MNKLEFVVTVPMPFTGESIVDGILVNWLVETGETVKKGQNIAEIETEKSVWEFEAPCDGEIVALKAEPGDTVEVRAPLLEIKTCDEDVKHLIEQNIAEADASIGSAGVVITEKTRSNGNSRRLEAGPRVKRLLRQSGIDETTALAIDGSGPNGRLTIEDVETFLKDKNVPEETPGTEVTSYLAGIGAYVPEKVNENSMFVPHFTDISEAYIEKVTGIKERRWVDDESTSDMAVAAAREALSNSNMKAADIDMIIVATTTPDMPLPATACMVQQKLGCLEIPAFDMQAACSGWLYSLSIAQAFIKARTYKNVLVIASETMSKYTDISDRATGFLFGDGAGAAIVSSNHVGHTLTDIVLNADSSGYDIINRKAGGALVPPRLIDEPKDEFWHMDGGRMFRGAVSAFSQVIESVSAKAKTALQDFKWFVPHQANQRILKTVASRVKAVPERFFSNIKFLGNTSAASIPLALKDLEKQNKVKSGDKLLLCAVGAGLTSAGCVITWK